MRGWSVVASAWGNCRAGSPAYAGMVLHGCNQGAIRFGFPRVCGDGPVPPETIARMKAVPPRMRGWSSAIASVLDSQYGSPAYAGMVLRSCDPGRRFYGFPRVCGDGPRQGQYRSIRCSVPPRMRGWSEPRGTTTPWKTATTCFVKFSVDQIWLAHPG